LKIGVFAVIEQIPVLSSFIDESADETRKEVYAVGTFLANEVYWRAIQDEWAKRLAQDGIAYFRSADCKSLGGPFQALIRKYGKPKAHDIANKLRSDLEDILLSYHWIGFGLGVIMPDYDEVFHITPAARMMYSEDPTETAYSQIMYEVALAVQRNAPEAEVAYIIDDSSYSGKIAEAFKATKRNHPELAKTMRTILPLDDRVTPCLQVADLIASVIKDGFLGWLKSGRKHTAIVAKWFREPNHFEPLGVWDKGHMLHSIRQTLKSAKFTSGELARRTQRKTTKAERKRMRKALIAKAESRKANLGR
jgi:hypothetical protein